MNREAYRFLNSARVLHWRYIRIKSKHDELESCLYPAGIRYDREKVQTSPDDSISRIVAEINELENEMAQIQKAKSEQIEKIDSAIRSLSSDAHKTALSMRFINRKSVADIASEMGYAESTIYKFMDEGAAQIIKSIKNII